MRFWNDKKGSLDAQLCSNMEDQIFGIGYGTGKNETTTLCQRTRKRLVEVAKPEDCGRESKATCWQYGELIWLDEHTIVANPGCPSFATISDISTRSNSTCYSCNQLNMLQLALDGLPLNPKTKAMWCCVDGWHLDILQWLLSVDSIDRWILFMQKYLWLWFLLCLCKSLHSWKIKRFPALNCQTRSKACHMQSRPQRCEILSEHVEIKDCVGLLDSVESNQTMWWLQTIVWLEKWSTLFLWRSMRHGFVQRMHGV